jgi:hypothetical protein
MRCRTTELSHAGGPACPNWQLTWPARVRSSDLVRLSFHLFKDLDDSLNAWPTDFVEHVIRFGAS